MFLFDPEAIVALNSSPQAMGFMQTGETFLRRMPQTVFAHRKNFFEVAETFRIFVSVLIHKIKGSGFGCQVSIVGGNN